MKILKEECTCYETALYRQSADIPLRSSFCVKVRDGGIFPLRLFSEVGQRAEYNIRHASSDGSVSGGHDEVVFEVEAAGSEDGGVDDEDGVHARKGGGEGGAVGQVAVYDVDAAGFEGEGGGRVDVACDGAERELLGECGMGEDVVDD